MRGVDHDVAAVFFTYGTGLSLTGIGRAEDCADFINRVLSGINKNQAADFAVRRHLFFRHIRHPEAGHKLHNFIKLVVAVYRTESLSKSLFDFIGHGESEFLLQCSKGLIRRPPAEFFAQHGLHRSVELSGLGHTHAVNLRADNPQAGAREQVDDISGARTGKTEVVGFYNNQCPLYIGIRQTERIFNDSAVGVGIFHPERENLFCGRDGRRNQNGRFKINNISGSIADTITVGSAHGVGRFLCVIQSSGGFIDFPDGVFAFEQQQHNPVRASGVGLRPEGPQNIVGEQSPAVCGDIRHGTQLFGETVDQLLTRAEHPRRDQIKSFDPAEPSDDTAGARFAQRVGGDHHESEFFCHNSCLSSAFTGTLSFRWLGHGLCPTFKTKKQKSARNPLKNLNEKITNQQTRLAVEIIETLTPHVLEHRHPADRVLLRFFKNRRELGSRDRRFLSECFFSYFRWLGWTRPLDLKPAGAAALSWLLDRTDLHAALQASVKTGWLPLGGRTLDEKRAALSLWFPGQAFETQKLIFPEFGKSADFPVEGEALLYEALQQRPPTWLRLRTEEFKKVLSEAGIDFAEHPHLAGAVSIAAGTALGPLGCGGQYEVQDVASQAVALIAAPESGSDWWDACAGAGGKAVQMADLIGPAGKILATDIREEALHECKKRARSGGISMIRTQLHDLAKDRPFTKVFDGVLVDAPCSGWGTWSRNPDARWRADFRDPAQKRNLQLKMLNNAAQCVKPGGVLVYAVCTFTREETSGVLNRFLSGHPEFQPEPFVNPLTGGSTGGTLQIWPWEGPGDGMFTARLRKAG